MKYIASLLIGFTWIMVLAWASESSAHHTKRYCQKPGGEIIIVTDPYLCPPGTWEI